MTMPALLDINVLIALMDPSHYAHHMAANWMREHHQHGWATCPLTQNGCIRILSQGSYPNPQPLGLAVARLAASLQNPHHRFVPDDLNTLQQDWLDWPSLVSVRHLTDLYLLGLAKQHQMRLLTLDAKIPAHCVKDHDAKHLAVIPVQLH